MAAEGKDVFTSEHGSRAIAKELHGVVFGRGIVVGEAIWHEPVRALAQGIVKMFLFSSARKPAIDNAGRLMSVSWLQSVNQGYPAIKEGRPLERTTRNWSSARFKVDSRGVGALKYLRLASSARINSISGCPSGAGKRLSSSVAMNHASCSGLSSKATNPGEE
jgi:hypothetical protein